MFDRSRLIVAACMFFGTILWTVLSWVISGEVTDFSHMVMASNMQGMWIFIGLAWACKRRGK